RHLDRIERRQHRWRGLVGLVGVPVVIRGRGISDGRIAVRVEVRHHMRDAVALAVRAPGFRGLDLAEIGREIELLLPAQALVGKDEHVMRQKRRDDRVLHLPRQGLRQVDAGEPCTKRRRELDRMLAVAPTPILPRKRGREPSGPRGSPRNRRVSPRNLVTGNAFASIASCASCWRMWLSRKAGSCRFGNCFANSSNRAICAAWSRPPAPPRSNIKVVVVTFHPSFSGPTRFCFGTTTSSKNTSLKCRWPLSSTKGRTSMPGVFISTSR